MPEQGPARIVHGDYGLHNTLIGPDGRVAAVVDWEISTLGDPLADLAYALNQWAEPGDPPFGAGVPPTALPGLPTRRELAARYAGAPAATSRGWTTTSASTAGRPRPSCTASTRATWRARRAREGVDLASLRKRIVRLLDQAEQAVGRLERRG